MKLVYLEYGSLGKDIDINSLRRFGDLECYSELDQKKTPDRVRDADIILLNKSVIDRKTLEKAGHLKLICELATGYDNIDIDLCREMGIAVVNAGHYSTTAVVQHTFNLALSLMGNIIYYNDYVQSGEYGRQKSFAHFARPVRELYGKTWGIVGMGSIGRGVAEIARAFGCEVIFYSPTGKSTCTDYRRVSFDELLTKSDIISLHCPLSDITWHLFDEQAFVKMKGTACLINVARGSVVDQKALAEALKKGQIACAGLDVLEEEPVSADDSLMEINDSEKLIITPHMAWGSVEARQRDMDIACENIEAFLRGEKKNRIV